MADAPKSATKEAGGTDEASKPASRPTAEVDAAGSLGIAATRLRDNAKWIVVTVGGLAATVFAGTGITVLTDLPVEPSTSRVVALLVGGGFALVGTAAALVLVAGLASASTVAVGELPDEQELRHDPALRPWRETHRDDPVGGLLEDYGEARAAHLGALHAWEDDPALDADTTLLERTARVQDAYEAVVGRLLGAASYLRLRRAFDDAVGSIAVALVLAFAGAGFFIWGASEPDPPPEPSTLDALAAPRGAWVVPADRIPEVGAIVGEDCVVVDDGERPRLDVLVVGPLPLANGDGDGDEGEGEGEGEDDEGATTEVVTLPDERCAAATFEVLTADLRALVAAPADPPGEEPTGTTASTPPADG